MYQFKSTNLYNVTIKRTKLTLIQWNEDCTIKVWDLQIILNTLDSQNCLLSTIAAHSGAVLCVRWSPKNSFLLASGSDDKTVVISLKQSTKNSSTFTSKHIENYKTIKTLHGHRSGITLFNNHSLFTIRIYLYIIILYTWW